MEEKKTARTPEETARDLSDLARKLEEMDKAEGEFGEPMEGALTDEYLEKAVGGLARIPVTTPPSGPLYKTCAHCRNIFLASDAQIKFCDNCLGTKIVDRT